MTKPASLTTSDGRKTWPLVGDDNVGRHPRGIGVWTPEGADDDTAHLGVATHLGGDRVYVADPVVLAGGVLTLADTLAAGIDDAVLALTVHSATSSPASEFVATIEAEDIRVIAGFGTTAWTIERGANDTTPASHAEDEVVSVVVARPLIVDAAGALVVAESARVNAELIVLASDERTTTQTQADQTNLVHRGVRVVLDVTAAGTASLVLTIEAKDPASGKYVAILTGTAVTTSVTTTYLCYPSAVPVAGLAVSDSLPLTWRIVVTAGNANAATYSVGACLLV